MIKDTGSKIQELRENSGLSQIQLAKILGKSQTTIKDIESSKNRLTKMDMILKLMDTFNVSFEYLFADSFIQSNRENDYIKNELELELSNMDYTQTKITYDLIKNYIDFKENK